MSTHDWEKHWGGLVDYLEGGLGPEAAAALERVLASSPQCREALAWLEATRNELLAAGAALTENAPEADLVDSVLDAAAWGDLADYAEGDLPSGDAARVEELMASSESLRASHAWLKETIADFKAAGEAIAADAPGIDLVDGVMAAVRNEAPRAEAVSLDIFRRRTRRVWLAAAAAAAVLVIAALSWMLGALGPGGGRQLPSMANGEPRAVPGKSGAGQTPHLPELAPTRLKLDEQKEKLEKVLMARQTGTAFEATAAPALSSVTMDDVITARRDAAGNPPLWGRLKQLASLTPADAARIAAMPGLSPAAMAGVAGAASPEQSQALLMTAVGHYPGDPCLRLELAQAIGKTGQATDGAAASAEVSTLEAAGAQLNALKEIDPANALPYYLEARLLFDSGDTEAALAVLVAAQAFDEASAYALESANYRIEALIAGGMAPDAARLVCALTGGVDQYTFLCELGGDLLEYGQYYLDAGDATSAEQIFEAVHQLGTQLDGNVDFAQEQLAALDIQDAAIDALEALYATTDSTANLEELTAQTTALFEGFQQIGDILVSLDALFFGEGSTDFWNRISDVILGQGDWTLLSYLEELASTAPSSSGEEHPPGQGSL